MFFFYQLFIMYLKSFKQSLIVLEEKTKNITAIFYLFTVTNIILACIWFLSKNAMNFKIFLLANNYHLEYFKIVIMILLSTAIAIIMLVVAYLLSLNNFKDSEKLSEYECGFDPFDSATRHPFDVHFYVVGILFLIFDIEIALLFPWVLGLKTIGWLGVNSMLFVLFILLVGFIYEWHKGALVWPQLS